MDPTRFVEINNRLVKGERISVEDEIFFADNAVNSDAMFSFIGDNADKRLYFFLPYLFGTTLNGAAVAPHRSYVIPCLHNEGYAKMAITQKMFHTVSAALFLSNAEMELAKKLYRGLPHTEKLLMGCGVDSLGDTDAERFRKKYDLGDSTFILYAGRRSPEKGVGILIDNFARYKKETGDRLKLLFIGPGYMPIPDEIKDDVIDLGFVSMQDKRDSYCAATLLCQPSVMESFSIVMMESWLAGRPVLVNADCDVTAEHTKESGGGFAFSDYESFREAVVKLTRDEDLALKMGSAGREYVNNYYVWPKVTDRFMELFESFEMAADPTVTV